MPYLCLLNEAAPQRKHDLREVFKAAQQAAQEGIKLQVIKLEVAKRGFVLLPRRRVVERSFAWANRFRRLVKDYERLSETLQGLHCLAFASLMVRNFVNLLLSS